MSLGSLDLDKVEWSASLPPWVVARILEIGYHCCNSVNIHLEILKISAWFLP
jgi:hypothetical protein